MGAPTISAASFSIPLINDQSQRLEYKIARAVSEGAGLFGNDIVTTTAQYTGTWRIYYALTDSVFTSVTFADGYSTGSLAGVTLLAGERIYGPIIGFKLASGSGILYRAGS